MTTKEVDTDGYKSLAEQRIIRQLALEWIQSELPTYSTTFVDCLSVLNRLQAATQDGYRTEAIFELVFEQANQLGKSSEWLALELQFETQALIVGNRMELIRLCLNQSNPVDDTALDTYNERLERIIKR